MRDVNYGNRVFINCPFDDEYKPMLNAMIFAIYHCGFLPDSALSEDNATDYRLEKILRCIGRCRYGIHDISLTGLNSLDLPRFNMPFETGLFFAAKYFGGKIHKAKNGLIFERTKYSYQKYISDLNGIDTKAHNGDPYKVIEKVRDWLFTASKRNVMPGSHALKRAYMEFNERLPEILVEMGLDFRNATFQDFCRIVEETVVRERSG